MRALAWLFTVVLLASSLSVAQAAERRTVIAGRTVDEWPPTRQIFERAPIVIFSHEHYACGDTARFLTQNLAHKGFWVFAPHHADAVCETLNASTKRPPAPEGREKYPSTWTAATYASRKDDLIAVLAALKEDPDRAPELDFSAIGLAGHGLGGYIVLGMAGARQEWSQGWDSTSIRGVVALSPYIRPYQVDGSWKGVSHPVMLQSGSLSKDVTPLLTAAETGAYAQISAPKYLAVFEKAAHSAWFGQTRFNDAINRYTTAFFQHYLAGDTTPILTQGGSNVSTFAYSSELGEKDASASGPAKRRFNGGSASRPANWRGTNGVTINDSTTRPIPTFADETTSEE